ncbi:MAG: helicase C-terminal domain-containing protein [Verrucomicrobiota bacterium]
MFCRTSVAPVTNRSRSALRRNFFRWRQARRLSYAPTILKFRQGVGRLIRTKTDTGIIVVLDNRVLTKQYGQSFLDALPKCPVEIV